jgi:hypothetical protein
MIHQKPLAIEAVRVVRLPIDLKSVFTLFAVTSFIQQ